MMKGSPLPASPITCPLCNSSCYSLILQLVVLMNSTSDVNAQIPINNATDVSIKNQQYDGVVVGGCNGNDHERVCSIGGFLQRRDGFSSSAKGSMPASGTLEGSGTMSRVIVEEPSSSPAEPAASVS
eukprot:scaffold1772_cov80-Cylindrotheca_fusiformis.AAC.12